MNLKEHLQFLAMMIPTFLLLFAAAFSLAYPASSLGGPVASATTIEADPASPVQSATAASE